MGTLRLRSVIEEAIHSKPHLKEISAKTLRSDAAAILESLLAELSEEVVLLAMNDQGFEGKAYMSSARAIADVARERRKLRGDREKARMKRELE